MLLSIAIKERENMSSSDLPQRAEDMQEKHSSSSEIDIPHSAHVEEARANGELDNLSLLEMKSVLVRRSTFASLVLADCSQDARQTRRFRGHSTSLAWAVTRGGSLASQALDTCSI